MQTNDENLAQGGTSPGAPADLAGASSPQQDAPQPIENIQAAGDRLLYGKPSPDGAAEGKAGSLARPLPTGEGPSVGATAERIAEAGRTARSDEEKRPASGESRMQRFRASVHARPMRAVGLGIAAGFVLHRLLR